MTLFNYIDDLLSNKNKRVIAYGMDYGNDIKTLNTITPQPKNPNSRNHKLSNANSYNGNIDLR